MTADTRLLADTLDATGRRIRRGDVVAVSVGNSWEPGIMENAWRTGRVSEVEVWCRTGVPGVAWFHAADVVRLSGRRVPGPGRWRL